MLVLSRKRDESIVIGYGPDQVVLTVIDIRGDKVRLGLAAPKHVPIHRQEVAEAIARSRLCSPPESPIPSNETVPDTTNPGCNPFA